MGLCNFLKTRQENEPTPKVPDGALEPDIVVYEDPELLPRQCQCVLEGEGLRWFSSPVYYWVDVESFGKWSASVSNVVINCMKDFEQVSGFRSFKVAKEGDANIRVYMRKLDGMGGTLGLAYQAAGPLLDMGAHQSMRPPFVGDIVLDLSENWTPSKLLGVMKHEVGHAIGLDHIEDDRALMNPYFVGTTKLHAKDIAATVERYGPTLARRSNA